LHFGRFHGNSSHFEFHTGTKNVKFVEDHLMNIHVQFGFFSETTNIIKAKLYMNVHWMVLYKLYVFCSDMKFKMAATAGLSLRLNPMGKMFRSNVNLCPAVVAILDIRSA
jgi:hypothetical protein